MQSREKSTQSIDSDGNKTHILRFPCIWSRGKRNHFRMKKLSPGTDIETYLGHPTNFYQNDDAICVICLETISQRVLLEPCRHAFCNFCILDWLQESGSCPLCKSFVQSLMMIIKPNSLCNLEDDCATEKKFIPGVSPFEYSAMVYTMLDHNTNEHLLPILRYRHVSQGAEIIRYSPQHKLFLEEFLDDLGLPLPDIMTVIDKNMNCAKPLRIYFTYHLRKKCRRPFDKLAQFMSDLMKDYVEKPIIKELSLCKVSGSTHYARNSHEDFFRVMEEPDKDLEYEGEHTSKCCRVCLKMITRRVKTSLFYLRKKKTQSLFTFLAVWCRFDLEDPITPNLPSDKRLSAEKATQTSELISYNDTLANS